MARPKKEQELHRSHHITVRLTDIEYELIMKRASEAGLTRSAYLRKQILDGSFEMHYEIVADMPELRKLTQELGKIGNNLNQISKYFHMGGVRSKAMQDEIHECIEQIFEMRTEVGRLAGGFYGSVKTHRK